VDHIENHWYKWSSKFQWGSSLLDDQHSYAKSARLKQISTVVYPDLQGVGDGGETVNPAKMKLFPG